MFESSISVRRLTALMCISATLLLGGCNVLSTPKTFNISQSMMQKAADSKWSDINQTMSKYGMSAGQPQIILLADKQRVGAKFPATVDTGVLGVKLSGDVQMSGVPMYSRDKNAIVLRDFSLDTFDIKDSPNMVSGVAKHLVGGLVGRQLGLELPVYTFKKDQLSLVGKNWLPEQIKIEGDGLAVTFNPHEKK